MFHRSWGLEPRTSERGVEDGLCFSLRWGVFGELKVSLTWCHSWVVEVGVWIAGAILPLLTIQSLRDANHLGAVAATTDLDVGLRAVTCAFYFGAWTRVSVFVSTFALNAVTVCNASWQLLRPRQPSIIHIDIYLLQFCLIFAILRLRFLVMNPVTRARYIFMRTVWRVWCSQLPEAEVY